MLSQILNLEGVQLMTKSVLKNVNGGDKHFPPNTGEDGGNCSGNMHVNGAPLC